MQTTGSGPREFWRGAALLLVLFLLEAGIVHAVGPIGAQVRVLGGLGDPSADAVIGLLTVLAVVAEVLALYLLLVLALRLAAWLPGASGQLALRGAELVTAPVLRCALDGLLGGVLIAQMVVAPVAARAGPVPPSDRPPAAAAAAIAGGSRVTADHAPGAASQASGTVSTLPAASTVPPPTWVPLPTWLGGSQVPSTTPPGSSTAESAPGPVPVQPPPQASSGPGHGAGAAGAGAAAIDPDLARSYVIRPGDTLWDVAAAHLPASQRSPSRIDRYWRQIHAANRAVLGDDPDLIHPGTRLALPPFQPARTGGG
jgi:hypothetical protein